MKRTTLARLPWAILAAAAYFPSAAAAFSPAPACQASDGYAASFDGRRTFSLHPDDLEAIKTALPNDPAIKAAYDELIRRADKALAAKSASVMDKRSIPVSGDRHDYVSLARYWWPNPANPKGAYVRRDGDTNPDVESNRFDRTALSRMARDADTLALAFYYSGERKYAEGAARVIRTWFLDPGTAMNPHMNFAQAVPGVSNGRAEGVLDGASFIGVIDAAGLIAPSGALTPDETRALESWFARYLDWMLKSANGKAEGKASNNHGLWYDAQVARFALFARKPEIARRIALAFPKARIAQQVDASGALPKELARTRSFHYSLYALDAAYIVADSAACLGIDLYRTVEKGRSLRGATDYVAAYRGRGASWPHKEQGWPADMLDELLVRADDAWGPSAYPRTISGDLLLRHRIR
ncbi:Alginate lyase [Sphingopyxis sp. YR583]|uniref:alginate lyase family protein n=1 Tax=Sphingopyxis sp. YR583 TaxID=1881047 RepID=UPI0008A75383|nr:alginate lyase family protein [Sphingopyxis sp. YR583]SEH16239.1 Alginate lyase [Sphingopyxis sp. YR583]